MSAVPSKAVPLFEYLENTHEMQPSEVAQQLGISRALYSKWRKGQPLWAWQIVLIKVRFTLRWSLLLRLLSKQYDEKFLSKKMKSYAVCSSKKRKA